ncbi:DnaD domain-containing protein [Cytobacillus purgationiresistens]|uniref:DNA replication protein n=1 Tax=Cytobacillus purgationiresistens TaxID=863449 RepID=A0ABU0AIG2_9BACI|nr:DnaD domain-containing protein [Cytobacillus purgationiresistens]MDQ0271045.1 DNA replication protein [Cytobacillus purgationiresistens]
MPKTTMLRWLQEGNITIPGVLLTQYKEMNLNEQELILILHMISFIEKGNEFPTPADLSARMTISVSECTDYLRKLIQKGFIEIKEENIEAGIRYEKYCLDSLWEKLIDHFLLSKKKEEAAKNRQHETDLYSIFENEFGRPLSPFECETLALWMDDDHHDPQIIKAALREAVMSGKLNFRYIDRILFEWKKNGIKTVEQALNHGKKFRQNQAQRNRTNEQTETPSQKIPFYNWLEQ